jgi:hypothetical protein
MSACFTAQEATQDRPARRTIAAALYRALLLESDSELRLDRSAAKRLSTVSFRADVLNMLHDAVKGAEKYFSGPGADYAGIIRELRLVNPYYGLAVADEGQASGSNATHSREKIAGQKDFALARKVKKFLLYNRLSDHLRLLTHEAGRMVGYSSLNLLPELGESIVSHSYEDGDALCLKLDIYKPDCQGFLSDVESLDDRDLQDMHPELVIQYSY